MERVVQWSHFGSAMLCLPSNGPWYVEVQPHSCIMSSSAWSLGGQSCDMGRWEPTPWTQPKVLQLRSWVYSLPKVEDDCESDIAYQRKVLNSKVVA
jgi:hypothetical protein